MRDGNPSLLLLLPDRHHVLRRRGQGLRSPTSTGGCAVQSDGVGHNHGCTVQLGLQVTDRIVFQLPGSVALDRGGPIHRSTRCDACEI